MFFAIGVAVTQMANTNDNYVKAESASVEQEFVMENGAAFRLYWTTTSCGITYTAKISDSLLDRGYSPKLFVVPYDYITTVLSSNNQVAKTLAESGDYKGAMDAYGYTYIDLAPYVISTGSGYSYLVGGVKTLVLATLTVNFLEYSTTKRVLVELMPTFYTIILQTMQGVWRT